MIGLGAQYLTAAGFGRYRITAASLGNLDLLGTLGGWLTKATKQAILGAFGDDGMAVINATNAYLNGIAASDRDKATALAGWLNTYAVEDAYVVVSIIPTTGYKRYVVGSGSQYFTTAVSVSQNFKFDMHIVLTGTTCGILGYNYGTRATRIFYLPGTLYAAFARADANTEIKEEKNLY